MKKLKIILILLLLFPSLVGAYSKYIIPGGDTIGIEVNSAGVMVIGFYPIKGKYNRGTPNINPGDYIIKVNDKKVNDVSGLTKEIEKNVLQGSVDITYLHHDKEKTSKLDLILDKGIYKTGLYVKDTITGIGTLSYIDPESRIFGALGHEINEASTGNIVEIKKGVIFRNYITSISKSSIGSPGSKNAKFYYDTKYGDIIKNTKYGIYGNYNKILPNKKLMEVGKNSDVVIGDAKIYTVLNGENIEEFKINIKGINETSKVKNIEFEITDENLINKTGGIIQGMSGSPIIQNDKITTSGIGGIYPKGIIIGNVTEVVNTKNVIDGYAYIKPAVDFKKIETVLVIMNK